MAVNKNHRLAIIEWWKYKNIGLKSIQSLCHCRENSLNIFLSNVWSSWPWRSLWGDLEGRVEVKVNGRHAAVPWVNWSLVRRHLCFCWLGSAFLCQLAWRTVEEKLLNYLLYWKVITKHKYIIHTYSIPNLNV